MEELEDSNNEFEDNQKQLRRELEGQSLTIMDLNENITSLKNKVKELTLEASINCNRFSFDDTCDVTRSFGLELNTNKENFNSQKKRGR